MKKCLSVLLASFAIAAFVSAQDSVLKKGTAGLIKDQSIDKLDLGIDDNKGLLFAGTTNNNDISGTIVNAGWGQYFGKSLWFSIYDDYNFYGSTYESESVTHSYGSADRINVDYTDTDKNRSVGSSKTDFDNDLYFGVAINKKMGFRPYWKARWDTYQTPYTITAGSPLSTTTTTIEGSSSDTSTGTNEDTEYSEIQHKVRNNEFGVKFAGIETPKLLGNRELYFALNDIRVKVDSSIAADDYSYTKKVNGSTTDRTSADGSLKTNYIYPGINAEAGITLGQLGAAKTKLVLEEDFEFGLEANESKTHHSVFTEDADQKKTVSTDYERKYGDYFYWKNTLTPKFVFDFDANDRVTLKARAKFALGLSGTKNDGDTSDVTKTTTTYNKIDSTTTVSTVHTTDGIDQNYNSFTTTLTPTFELGCVYKAIPDRLNLNFGLRVTTGTFTWTKEDDTNTNENRVTTTTNKDALGNKTSTTTVNVNSGDTETSSFSFNNDTTSARLFLGTTWFFTKDVNMDLYYSTTANALFANTNTFGIDFVIRY